MKQDSEKNAGNQAFIPEDMVEEPIPDVYVPPTPPRTSVPSPVEEHIPCVYGPPEWYDRNGNLDDNHSSVRRFKEKIKGFYSRLFEKKRK